MTDQEIAHQIAELVEAARDSTICHIIRLLESGALGPSSSAGRVRHQTGMTGSVLDKLVKVLRISQRIEPPLPPSTLAMCLATALATTEMAREKTPRVDLVWTGPLGFRMPARATLSVLEEIVRNAEREIVLVGYSITPGAEPVFECLASAARRGARVIIVGNRLEEQLAVVRQLWPAELELPELYSRHGDPEDPYAALHAKLIVADGSDMLVTSANLSEHGLRGNIEIGMRLRGSLANDVRELVRALIQDGLVVSLE